MARTSDFQSGNLGSIPGRGNMMKYDSTSKQIIKTYGEFIEPRALGRVIFNKDKKHYECKLESVLTLDEYADMIGILKELTEDIDP